MLDNLKSLVVRIATILKGKVDKVTGKSLVSDTLITKLQGLEKVTASEYLADNKLKLTLSDNSTVVTTNAPDLSGYVQKETGKSLIDITLANTIPQKVDKVPGKGLLKSEIASNLETNWTEFVNATKKYPTAIAITGTDTKKLVLTLNDSTTLESQWVDLKGSDVDFSGAGFDASTGKFKINSSTQFSIDGRYRLLSSKIPWADIEGAPAGLTLPSWVGATKPTYSWTEITGKPSLNFLPLTGGTIEPGDVTDYREGIRINKAANNWSVLTLGTTGDHGMQSGAWVLLKNPSGEFQIGPNSQANSGLRLSTDFPYWKGGKMWNSFDNVVRESTAPETGRNLHKETDLYVTNLGYNNLNDRTYYNSLTFRGGGVSQLILPWLINESNPLGGVFYRQLRDVSDPWSDSKRIYSQHDNFGDTNLLSGRSVLNFRSGGYNWYVNNGGNTLATVDGAGCLAGQFPNGLVHKNPDFIELEAETWYTYSCSIRTNKNITTQGTAGPLHFHFREMGNENNVPILKAETNTKLIFADRWTVYRISFLTSAKGRFRPFIYLPGYDASFQIRWVCLEQGNLSTGYTPTAFERDNSFGDLYRGTAKVIDANTDAWLRINTHDTHTSGVYFNTSIVRTDNKFEVGSTGSGALLQANNLRLGNTLGINRWGGGSDIIDSQNTLQFGSNNVINLRKYTSGGWSGNSKFSFFFDQAKLSFNEGGYIHKSYLVGAHATASNISTHINPIYAIGEDYTPPNLLTAGANFYGIGYTHENSPIINETDLGFSPNSRFAWGLYVASVGKARYAISGNYGHSFQSGLSYANGFVKRGGNDDSVLLAGGGMKALSQISSSTPVGEINGNWTYNNAWKDGLIYSTAPGTVNLAGLENKTGLSFINLHTGTVVFAGAGLSFTYLGHTAFQGARGTSCTVNRRGNEVFIHINRI